ncbi:MAG: class II aldolase/adducin family protein [Planctomycetota bacterium]
MYLEARQTVLDACRELADRGYLPGTGGNIAARASKEWMAITPSGCDYYTMTVDDICLVDLTTDQKTFGERKPSVEVGIHRRLLVFRPDFDASIHTHQPVASAATLLGQPLPIERPKDRQRLGPYAPLVGYAPSGTGMLANKFGKALRQELSAYLLRNHGIVCGGATMRDAIENVGRLERAAKDYLIKAMARQPAAELRERMVASLDA